MRVTQPAADGPSDRILRFHRSERVLHWSIAVPFMVCFGTAAVLVVLYNADPQRPFRQVFSWTHRVSGVCLIVFPLLTLVRNRADFRLHLENIREGWVWARDDLKWLFLSGLAAVSKRVALPDQGKFNAAEKVNFMMVMSTYPLCILTGVLIWLPGVAFYSWLLHLGMAALVLPLLLGHIFMATINPSTRVGLSGMISGFVERTWAQHHYARWYRKHFPEPRPAARAARPAVRAPVAGSPAKASCSSCSAEHELIAWSGNVGDLLDAHAPVCPNCGDELQRITVVASTDDLDAILRELETAAIGGHAPCVAPSVLRLDPLRRAGVAESGSSRYRDHLRR